MAEWLRRLTRNQMGSSRVGSNPTRSDDILFFFHLIRLQYKTKADHDGDRTHNLPIRSRTPYPLGHAAFEIYFEKLVEFPCLCVWDSDQGDASVLS